MKTTLSLQNIIVVGFLFLMTYSLAMGIKKGNALGITLALASMAAFGICIHLVKKLQSGEDPEQY